MITRTEEIIEFSDEAVFDDDVLIQALEVVVRAPVRVPGRNITIVCSTLSFVEPGVIDTSSIQQKPPKPAKALSGVSWGDNGKDGAQGIPSMTHGGNISVFAEKIVNLRLRCLGSPGGDGGDGGDGYRGQEGTPGPDGSKGGEGFHAGGAGTPGGPGGKAGLGGSGGVGSNGGQVVVLSLSQLPTSPAIENTGGVGGLSGEPGEVGQGGIGGLGGFGMSCTKEHICGGSDIHG